MACVPITNNVPVSTSSCVNIALTPSEGCLLLAPRDYSIHLRERIAEAEYAEDCVFLESAFRSDAILQAQVAEVTADEERLSSCAFRCCHLLTTLTIVCALPWRCYVASRTVRVQAMVKATMERRGELAEAVVAQFNRKYADRALRVRLMQHTANMGLSAKRVGQTVYLRNVTQTSYWLSYEVAEAGEQEKAAIRQAMEIGAMQAAARALQLQQQPPAAAGFVGSPVNPMQVNAGQLIAVQSQPQAYAPMA